jgi:hypothetical protein
MKTVYRAFFIENGASLITLVSNHVEKHELSATEKGELVPNKLWTAKIKHCVNVVEAPQAKRLVATDTSGRHFGICSATGEILWQSKAIGEGDPGIIFEDRAKPTGSEEVFVFVTWPGVLQRLSPDSGKDAAQPVKLSSKLRGLQVISDDQRLFITGLIPAQSDSDPVGENLNLLDYSTNELIEVASNTFSMGIKVSPSGETALFVYLAEGASGLRSDRSERWEIKDIQSGMKLCERTFKPGEFFSYDAVWSPDSQFIAARNSKRDGHLILTADTLETVALIEGRNAERPAFNPQGTHICLCRADNTAILPIDTLISRH